MKGDIEGGLNAFTGSIHSGGKIASLTVNGSLLGGSGTESGRVTSSLDMGAVLVSATWKVDREQRAGRSTRAVNSRV